MKKVLCFGDSNTYGFNPNTFLRYKENERWCGIIKEKFNTIECGCNNRTCFNNKGELNSINILPKYLLHKPEVIILQIGINDLQFIYNSSLIDLKNRLFELINLIDKNIQKILLCPNIIDENILNSYFSQMFDKTSIKKSKELIEIYQDVANITNSKLINQVLKR